MTISRFAHANDSPGFLLWQLTNLWQQHIRAALAPLDITHVQFVLLASIAWLTEQDSATLITQALLSRHARTDIMMTSQVVRTLETKGLITRTEHPTDTRAKVVSLTTEGHRIIQAAMQIVETADEQFFKGLGEQMPTFAELTQRLLATDIQDQSSSHEE